MPTSVSVQLSCPTNPPFAAQPSANGRYLVDQYGAPWLMASDASWALAVNSSQDQLTSYFALRKAQGFNCAQVAAVDDAYSGGRDDLSTYDGILPFTGTVAGQPDMTTPNPVYWARVDALLTTAASYGFTVLLLPADCSNNGAGSACMTMARANGNARCVAFGNWIGTRYRWTPNIIWWHGDDYSSGSDDTYVGGICDGIRAVSPQIQTVQIDSPPGVNSYSLVAPAWASRITLDLVYQYHTTTSYTISQAAYAASPTMPAFSGEPYYEGDPGWSAFIARQQEYWTFLTGGCGHNYGRGDVEGVGAASTGSTQFMYCRALFAGLAWWTLVPDTTNAFLTSGFSSGATLALGAVAVDGSLGVVYASVNGPVMVNMTKMRGTTALCRWYDPTAGTFATIGSFASGAGAGTHSFTNPAAHGDGNADYVLVLTA